MVTNLGVFTSDTSVYKGQLTISDVDRYTVTLQN